MKLKVLMLVLFCIFVLTACGKQDKAKEEWYLDTLEYYRTGFQTGWSNEKSNLYISDEMKNKDNKFGYLLKDLDGDGTMELLIGIDDGTSETKFTDIYILHRDFGPYRSFTTSDGYYMYLCDDNVIKSDSWYGSETKTDYMKYDGKENSFPIVDGGSKPRKYDLTPL